MNRHAHSVLKEIGFTLLAEGKTLKVKAEGYSMYPTIRPGSVIYIEPFQPGSKPVPGEIVAWKKDSGFVVHRLVSVINEGAGPVQYITRGDSCISEDDPVTFDQLAGRVVRVETSKGRIASSAQRVRRPVYMLNRMMVRIRVYSDKIKKKLSF